MTTSASVVPNGFARVLVASDFRLEGDRALRRVARLPLGPRATVTIIHVLPRSLAPAVATVVNGAAQNELDAASEKLLALLDRRGRHDVVVHTRLAHGEAADEISRAAQANAAELIVVGRGQHRFGGFLGTTAQRVVHQARMPVLLVRRPATRPYLRVVLGMDPSPDGLRAARYAARLTQAPKAAVFAVHAFEDPRADLAPVISAKVAKARWRAFMPELAQTSKRVRAALRMADARRPWSVSFKPGDPRGQLLAAVERRGADLLVVGTRSTTGLPKLILGSVAETMLRRAVCDVLVCPRRRWVA